jgi:hypothetical protein
MTTEPENNRRHLVTRVTGIERAVAEGVASAGLDQRAADFQVLQELQVTGWPGFQPAA